MKYDINTNSIMLNSMVKFTFSVLDQKYINLTINLVQKSIVVCLRLNLVSSLIQIC